MKKENINCNNNTPSPALPGILSLQGRGNPRYSFLQLYFCFAYSSPVFLISIFTVLGTHAKTAFYT